MATQKKEIKRSVENEPYDLEGADKLYGTLFDVVNERYDDLKRILNNFDEMALVDSGASAYRWRVGFYGPRGRGKTSLVNRTISGRMDLPLPTGKQTTTKSSVTQILGWKKLYYAIVVHFITLEDWSAIVERAQSDVKTARDEGVSGGKPLYAEFHNQIKCLWTEGHHFCQGDLKSGYGWEGVTSEELIPEDLREFFYNTSYEHKADTIDELHAVLYRFTNRSKQGWPLVKKINVRGPFKNLLEAGFTVLDILGEGGGDSYLSSRMRDGIAQCDKLYYVPKNENIESDNTVDVLLYPPSDCTEFGVVINYATELDDEYNFVEKIKSGLKTWVRNDAVKTQIEQTRIFLMENDDKSAQFERLLNEFLRHLAVGVEKDVEAAIDSLLSQVNLNLEAIKPSVSGKVACLEKWKNDIESLFATQRGIDLPNYPNQIEIPQQFPDDRSKPRYNTLQCRLTTEWYPERITVVLSSSQIPFYQTTVQDLFVSLCQDIDTKLKKLSPEQMKSGDSRLACAFKSSKEMLLNTCEKTFRAMSIEYTVENITPKMQWEVFRASGLGCRKKMLDSIEDAWSKCRQDVGNACSKHMHEHAIRYFKDMCKQLQGAIAPHLDYCLLPNVPLTEIQRYLEPITRTSTVHSVSYNSAQAKAPLTVVEQLEELIKNNEIYMSGSVKIPNLRGSSGEVYVFSNQSMPDIFKIGHSISPKRRAKHLDTTGVPMPFKVEITWETTNTRMFERIMHNLFNTVRVRLNREFFQAPLKLIKEAGGLVHKYVHGLNE